MDIHGGKSASWGSSTSLKIHSRAVSQSNPRINPPLWHNSTVRRLLPFILLATLGAGTALGAVLGTVNGRAQASPAQWVVNVLAATAQAGSAQFSFSRISTSPNPALVSHLNGSGLIDFTLGDVRTTQVDHDVQFSSSGPQGSPSRATPFTNHTESLGIGTTVYEVFGGIAGPARWNRLGIHRNPNSNLGLMWAGDADEALGPLGTDQRIIGVQSLGSATVDGTPTTRYLVTSAPVCAAPRVAHASSISEPRRTMLWLDRGGRLVQVRTTESDHIRLSSSNFPGEPGLAKRMSGQVATTATLHFSAFGHPVHVSAPPADEVNTSSNVGVSEIECASKAHAS
jgi:hypothetical protein